MSGNVHPNSGSCSVCVGNVTCRGRSVQCCTWFKRIHLKCSLLSFSRFKTLGSSHSWSCSSCYIPDYSGDPITANTVSFSLDFSSLYTSTVQSGPSKPPWLMQYSYSNHAFKPLIPILLALNLLPLYPRHHFMSLAVFLYLQLPFTPDSLRVFQWNDGGLRARSTKLLHFISSHAVDLICIQESNLSLSSSFRIPGFSALRSDHTHSWSGILSPDGTHASGGVIIFVKQDLSFSELSVSSLSSLDLYSDYVGVNISQNNFSSLSFLNGYAPSICSSRTESRTHSFSPSILSSSRNLFILGDFNYHHPLWESKGTSDPVRRKYSTGSSLLTSFSSMTLIYLLFSITPVAVAPLLRFPLLPPLWPCLAPGRYFRT